MTQSNNPIGIDATALYCPEFTTPVMSLIKQHIKADQQVVIKTKEPRSVARIKHLCASFEWNIVDYQHKDGLFYFLIATM